MERETFNQRYERLSAGPRVTQVQRILAELEDGERALTAARRLIPVLVDATLDSDENALQVAADGLQHVESMLVASGATGELLGRVRGATESCVWALTRIPSPALLAEFERDGRAVELLQHVAERPGTSNTALADELGIDPAQVSRLGRRLQGAGLVRLRRIGRTNAWTLTSRGIQTAALLQAEGVSRPQRPHRLLAQG